MGFEFDSWEVVVAAERMFDDELLLLLFVDE